MLTGETPSAFVTEIVLFDLEGTLVKTKGPITIRELRRRTKRKLLELGIPRRSLSMTNKATLMRNRAYRYVEKHFDNYRRELFELEFDRFMKEYEIGAALSSEPYGETHQVLRELTSLGCILGIVTNTSKEALELVLSKHGIRSFFRILVTREDVKLLKPSPEGIQTALRRLRIRHSRFFFVGDSLFDLTAAAEANGISILVCRDGSKRSTKLAHYIVRSLSEISHLVVKYSDRLTNKDVEK